MELLMLSLLMNVICYSSKILRFMSKDLKDFMFTILDPDPSTRLSASELWKLPWIQAISRSGQAVTPPPSPVQSVLERNRLYWEEEERKLPSTSTQPHEPHENLPTLLQGILKPNHERQQNR